MPSYTTQFKTKLGASDEVIDVLVEYGADFDGDGFNDIKVTLGVASGSNSGTEDIIGVGFDINDSLTDQSSIVSGLRINDVTTIAQTGATILNKIDEGTSTNADSFGVFRNANNIDGNDPGFPLGGAEPFDIGIRFSDGGTPRIKTASFVISKPGANLDKTLIEQTDWYVRLQSTDGGQESAKTAGTIGIIGGETPTPLIDVEKYVSVDGGLNWEDADTVTGPSLLTGNNPLFKFVVTNIGNVDLSNVSLSDSDFSLDGLTGDLTSGNGKYDIGALAAGGSKEVTFTGTWQADQHTNTATTNGSYNGTNISDTDDANYFGAAPSIDVEKLVSVNGGQTFVDADSITGPFLLESGADPIFKFVVTNTGNVALSNLTLSDSDFDINGAAAGTNITIASLAAGATYETTFTAPWQAGQHTNTATVNTNYTDGGGNTAPLSDTDDANYFGATPSIDVEKFVSGDGGQTWQDADTATGPSILSGNNPQFKFVVTNTGNVALSNVTLDDNKFDLNGAAAGTAITIGSLAAGAKYETTFTGTWQAGQHTNTATTTGTFADGGGNTSNPSDSDAANYFGINPSINIDKVTNNFSVQGDALLIQEASAIEWIYTVTNTGNVGLSNISVTDNKGVTPVGVDANNDGFIDGDINKDSILGTTETWTYKASGTAILGSYQNTGTATGSVTDDFGNPRTVNDSDDSSYTGVKPAGARTPGFWKNWAEVWNGNASDDSKFAGREGFPGGDILLAPYTASTTDPVTGNKTLGVLVGDWNRNGVTDGTEKTLFYTVSEAMTIISADQKTQQDKRYTLDRSLVASWLNYLAVNPAPQGDMNQAIQWIQQNTPNENGIAGGDGNLVLGASTWAVPASSQAWANPSDVYNGLPTGEILNAKLDYYNNTGSFGVQPV